MQSVSSSICSWFGIILIIQCDNIFIHVFVNVFTELVNTEGFSSQHNQTKIYLFMFCFFKGMSLS